MRAEHVQAIEDVLWALNRRRVIASTIYVWPWWIEPGDDAFHNGTPILPVEPGRLPRVASHFVWEARILQVRGHHGVRVTHPATYHGP